MANAFVLSEVLRIFRVPPFGAHLQQFMEPFVDRRDQGVAVLTHMYLLLGCAIPIWCDVVLRTVSRESDENKQPRQALQPTMLPFSGLVSTTWAHSYVSHHDACDSIKLANVNRACFVAWLTLLLCLVVQLSIGVLDSLAAVFGKRYGRTKWPGTSKTVEGTLCAIAGTLAVAHAINAFICGGQAHWAGIGVPVVIVALLEACTQQIDNLVLPVVCAILVLVIEN